MKFDKIMSFGYKFLCVAVALAVVLGCVSCCLSPVKAHAVGVDLDAIEAISDFKEVAEQRAVEVGRAINTDILNGNLDATTEVGKKALQAFAAQMIYLNSPDMGTIAHAVDLALQTVPDFSAIEALPENSDFSSRGISALYTSYKDGRIHQVTGLDTFSSAQNAHSVTYPLAVSDEFSVSITFSSDNFNVAVTRDYNENNSSIISVGKYLKFNPTQNYNYSVSDSSGYFTNRQGQMYMQDWANFAFGSYYYKSTTTPRTLNQNLLISTPTNGGYQACFGDMGLSVSTPSASVPTMQPWKYYNDTLLPDIYNNYGDINNTYILFPNGYQPAPTPDPTEPATFPNGGVWIGNNYDIDINFYTPTDASGQPITDEQGETVTETYAVTDTRPTDAVYRFQIPTLPHIEKYSAENIVPDLSSFTEGIRFVFTATTDILQESGFLPVVVAGLSLGAVAAVLMLL